MSNWPDHAEACSSFSGNDCDCELSDLLDDLEREERAREENSRRYSELYYWS